MTSSVQPPVLNPTLGTPSSEWAKNTTSSLDPSSQGTSQSTTSERPTEQSPSGTPGNEFPGAFPNRDQGETSTGTTTNITETVVGTAKQYLPASVVNTVETFLGKPLSPRIHGKDSQILTHPKAAIATPPEPREQTKMSGLRSMTSTTKHLSPLKNYVEPFLANTSAVWGLSLGLPSRKAWLSFQTKKQSCLNVTLLQDVTPLGIKPQATVSLSSHLSNLHLDSHPFSSGEHY